jgi:hypothetical protein
MMAVAEPYDTELTPAQKQSAVDMGLSNQPNQDSGFDPAETSQEYADLRAIREKLPGAYRDIATAEGKALRAKSEADIAGAKGDVAAAEKRGADVRGSYDAYGERIAKEPLPAFVPSEDNAETLGALFSGVNLLGLIMSRGAGRSSALGAMKSMTGMLEGYRTGRKDLYEREKQIFEKNYARIKDIHAQYGKELDQALKLSEVDFESGKARAQLAAKRAGNKYAEDMASVGNLKAVVAAFNAEVTIIDKMNNIRKSEEDRLSRERIAAAKANKPGTIPAALSKDLKAASELQSRFDQLIASAKPEFFQPLKGPAILNFSVVVNAAIKATKAGLVPEEIAKRFGISNDTVQWWMAYEDFNSDVRKERYGATLTGNEKESFQRTIIEPNTNRELALQYMAEKQKIINDAANKTANRARVLGVSPQVIASYFGSSPGVRILTKEQITSFAAEEKITLSEAITQAKNKGFVVEE